MFGVGAADFSSSSDTSAGHRSQLHSRTLEVGSFLEWVKESTFSRPVTSFRRRGVRFPLTLYLQKNSYYEHECISSLTHMHS